jgi:uncharacterized alpha-E superfamily protein
MLSRIADSLFWMNRYMERADGLLRLLHVHYSLSLDKDINGGLTWKPVLEIFTPSDKAQVALLEDHTEAVLKRILVDSVNHNSLKALVNKARENARGVQDHITKEVWEEVNQMYHLINQPTLLSKLTGYKGLEVIDTFKRHTVIYTGIVEITMSRGMGWRFMNLGKYIERCLQTIVYTEKQVELMKEHKRDANDILQWRYLLLSLSGYELHLKTYRTANHNYNAVHQVLLNENFARSVIYSLNHIDDCLKYVTYKTHDEETNDLIRSFGQLYSKVKYIDRKQLELTNLQPMLAEVKDDLLTFSRILGQHFFAYS